MNRKELWAKLKKNGISSIITDIPFGKDNDVVFRVMVTHLAVYTYNPENYIFHDLVEEQFKNGKLYDEIWGWVKSGIEQGLSGSTYTLKTKDFPCIVNNIKVVE